MSTHVKDPETSRAQILDSAEKLFAEKGFSGTSMSQVARLSGKSQSLIHHHFGNKKGLYNAVKERFGEQFGKILLPLLRNQSVGDGFIRNWSKRYLAFWRERPHLRRIMLWRRLENDNDPWEATNEIFLLSLKKIEESQEQGVIRSDLNPGHLITVLSSAHLGWLNNKPAFCHRNGLNPDDPEVDEAYLKDIENILLNGVLNL